MDKIELCCTQDKPVEGKESLTAMWKDAAGVAQWFYSDRYNYLYVRTASNTECQLPWKELRVELHLAFRRFANEDYRDYWRELLSNRGNNFVNVEHGMGMEPFLIPPVFSGEYTIIAELKTGSNEQSLQQINIACQKASPCVWEDAYSLAEGETIRLDGGTWTDGSWRFLSRYSGQQGTLTKGEEIPLRLASGEEGILLPSISVKNLRLLAGLRVEKNYKEDT